MFNLIFEKLILYFPQLATYALVALIVGFIVYKGTRFYINTNNACNKFPEFENTLQKIDKGMMALNTVLLEKNVIGNSIYSDGNSPRIVNELGERLFQQSNASAVFDSQKEEFLQELEKGTYDSNLEVEQAALQLLLNRMQDPTFSTIQDFVYNHPKFEGRPLSYVDIIHIMSLKLRDMYLLKHNTPVVQ